jgi:hypothetical protein
MNTQDLFIDQGGQSKANETLRIVSTTRTGHWRFLLFANKNESEKPLPYCMTLDYAGVAVIPMKKLVNDLFRAWMIYLVRLGIPYLQNGIKTDFCCTFIRTSIFVHFSHGNSPSYFSHSSVGQNDIQQGRGLQ